MENKLHILLIEDDILDVKIFQRILRDDGDSIILIVANRLEDGIEILQNQPVDLIVVDPGLPDSSGAETIQQVLVHGQGRPVIVLTGSDDEELPVQAIDLGAHDYLIKDTIDKQSLKRSIRYTLEKNILLKELKKKTRQLENSESRFRHIIENNSDSTLIINKNGMVIFVNKAAEKLFGRSQDNFIGKAFDYPIQQQGLSEIKIKCNGQIRNESMQVFETEWQGEKAYLVSLQEN